MISANLIFPKKFNASVETPDDPNGVIAILSHLWSNIKAEMISYDGMCASNIWIELDGQKILLPRSFPDFGCENILVLYFQEILDINKIEMIAILDGNEHCFEILTPAEFESRIQFPRSEYQAHMNSGDGIPIMHPTIPICWIYVAPKIGKTFPPGDGSTFDRNSIAYQSLFGPDN